MKQDTIYMLIHGFGGGPFELEALKKNLENDGIKVYDLALPGHLDGKNGLRKCKHSDWIAAVEQLYLKIRRDNENEKKVAVIGFSMGGLLGARLAQKLDIDALITLNTPIYYWNIKNIVSNIGQDLVSGQLESLKRYIHSCTMYPVNALWHFQVLLHIGRRSFKGVTCPVLVIQALDDDAVHYKSAEYIVNTVCSSSKKKYLY